MGFHSNQKTIDSTQIGIVPPNFSNVVYHHWSGRESERIKAHLSKDIRGINLNYVNKSRY